MLVFEVSLWHEIEGRRTRFLNIVSLSRALEFYQEAGFVLLHINPVF